MNKRFVIRSIRYGGYYDGGKNFGPYMHSKEYNFPEEAEKIIIEVLEPGAYSIDRVFIKLPKEKV